MSVEELVQALRNRDEDAQILLQTGYAGEKPPREMLRLLDIQGYHDKAEGPDHLLLWVDVALKASAQLKKIRETEQEIMESRAQLRRLSARLLHLQEEERERISRELHDHLGQLLTAIGMDVEWAREHCPKELRPVGERLQEAASLVQEAIQATRELSTTLRPEALNGLGLEAALRGYVTEFARRSGLLTHFSSHLSQGEVSPEQATNIYRIVQEALNNVARHAAATQVTVEVQRAEKGLVVLVVDNGKGFEVAKVSDPQALCLVGMQERARLVGGRLEVLSAPRAGTSVRLEVPL
jgi:signal transduction histidine kinase